MTDLEYEALDYDKTTLSDYGEMWIDNGRQDGGMVVTKAELTKLKKKKTTGGK